MKAWAARVQKNGREQKEWTCATSQSQAIGPGDVPSAEMRGEQIGEDVNPVT